MHTLGLEQEPWPPQPGYVSLLTVPEQSGILQVVPDQPARQLQVLGGVQVPPGPQAEGQKVLLEA